MKNLVISLKMGLVKLVVKNKVLEVILERDMVK